MSNNCKVKGILRGIRFISQIFDSDKEQEIEIGHPTDVKHVAHIGWQGPSAENNPSWMNEFKSVHGLSSSAPLSLHGDIRSQGDDNSAQWLSEDSIKRGSRRQSMGNMRESHAKEKSDRPRNSKTRSSKSKESSCNNNNNNESTNSKCSSEQSSIDMDSIQQQIQGCSSDINLQPPKNNLLPDIPKIKRTSSNQVKDASSNAGSTSTKSRSSRAQRNLNKELSSRSGHKARKKHRHLEEDQSESEQDQDQDQDQDGHQIQSGSDKILLTN